MNRTLRNTLRGYLCLLLAAPALALLRSEQTLAATTDPESVTAIWLSEIGADVAPANHQPKVKAAANEKFYQVDERDLFPPEVVAAPTTVAPVEPVLPALPEESAPRKVDSLHVARALELVWAENPQVVDAEKAIESAGYDVRGSYGGFLPSVTVSNSFGRDALSSVQASLPLWNGGLTLAEIDGSKAREIQARATLDRVRLTLGVDTLTAFYNLAQAQEQLRQWSRYLAALDRLRVTIGNRANEGVAPQSELQTAISRIRQAEVGQEAARLLLLSSRNALGKLLNIAPESVQWQDDGQAVLRDLSGVDTGTLVNRHPEVMIAAAQLAEQTALVQQAKAQLYPEVALQYRHYYSGQAFDRTADSPQLVLQYQVGNTYKALQRVSAEKSKMESSRAKLDVARREVQATLSATREQVLSSSRQWQLQKQASANTQALVESFLRQYQVGRRSWIEVLNAQREAHENELNTIASRKAYVQSSQQLALQMLAWDALLREPDAATGTTTAPATANPAP